MNITVFGASGRVGQLVVIEALRRGHSVIGVVHSAKDLSTITDNPSITRPMKSKLELRQADVHDAQTVADSIKQSHAVISALGSWGTPSKDIVASGMRTIIPAMKKESITRIVSLTGTEAYDKDDTPNFIRRLAHTTAGVAAGKILHDGEEHIRLLRESNLNWTVLRSPIMTSGPSTNYTLILQPLPPWQSIARRTVAKAIVDQVEMVGSQTAPFIYKS